MTDPLLRPRGPIPSAGPLFSPPIETLVRRTDPATSREAARRIDLAASLDVLARAFRAALPGGLTAEEAADRTGIDGAWKRVSDLRRLGHIEPTGETRTSRSNRPQRVMRWRTP